MVRGGVDTTRSNVIDWPCLSVSFQTGRPPRSGSLSYVRIFGRQVGGPAMRSQSMAGGERKRSNREATWALGNIIPITAIAAIMTAKPITAKMIHFIQLSGLS